VKFGIYSLDYANERWDTLAEGLDLQEAQSLFPGAVAGRVKYYGNRLSNKCTVIESSPWYSAIKCQIVAAAVMIARQES
jgi:hypothetical protein